MQKKTRSQWSVRSKSGPGLNNHSKPVCLNERDVSQAQCNIMTSSVRIHYYRHILGVLSQ